MCAGALAAGRRAKESVVKGKNVSPTNNQGARPFSCLQHRRRRRMSRMPALYLPIK